MALDFPTSPTNGQKYPASPVAGVPTYTYDGEKWTTGATPVSSVYVAKAGDTMTGDLLISKATPIIELHKAASGQGNYIVGYTGINARWLIAAGTTVAESGSNTGSNFAIINYNDAGTQIGQPLTIDRASGAVAVAADPTVALGVATKSYVDTGNNATAAEYTANSAPTKKLTSGAVWSAGQYISLTDAATVTPDFNAGFDFRWTLAAAGRALANPTNLKPGQKGLLYIMQDGTGNRTITGWGTAWKFPSGIKPTLSTAALALDIISYAVVDVVTIVCTFTADVR